MNAVAPALRGRGSPGDTSRSTVLSLRASNAAELPLRLVLHTPDASCGRPCAVRRAAVGWSLLRYQGQRAGAAIIGCHVARNPAKLCCLKPAGAIPAAGPSTGSCSTRCKGFKSQPELGESSIARNAACGHGVCSTLLA